MKLVCTKIITTETIDHITGEKSTSIVKFWDVEYKNKKYTRYLDAYKVKWENPEWDHIEAISSYYRLDKNYQLNKKHQKLLTITNNELEILFRDMIREKKLEKIITKDENKENIS